MDVLTYTLAGALLLVAFLLSRTGRKPREKILEVCKNAADQTLRKHGNKEKIRALVRERAEVSNEEIRKHLGVTARTVVNYMDELEREGSVEQVGATGRGVVYRAHER